MTSHLRALWEKTGMLVVLIVLLTLLSIFVPYFCSWKNASGLALSVSTVGLISCTMLFCLASGDFDLSVGSVAAMSGVIAAVVTNATNSVAEGIAAGILAGGVVGLFNGFVIAVLGINALITTLASMQIARGLAFIVSGGTAVGVSDPDFFTLGITQTHLFGQLFIPAPVWVMICSFLVFAVLLNRTTFGRNALAIGGNAEAARLAGVAVRRTKIIIFTLQGLVAGFAGVIEASRFTSGQPNSDYGLELDVISACVLGGVSLTGGVGTMLGVVVGVFIMGAVTNAMNLKNIDTFYQYVVRGGILITAVLIDKLKQYLTAA
jgi:L-arabinose transport system permease protein